MNNQTREGKEALQEVEAIQLLCNFTEKRQGNQTIKNKNVKLQKIILKNVYEQS